MEAPAEATMQFKTLLDPSTSALHAVAQDEMTRCAGDARERDSYCCWDCDSRMRRRAREPGRLRR